ncbi:MAG: PPOX class F420-dependent oxidoreductase [Ilumatobacter sp.]|uniref:PPOX class F420-dependent oxidoreductase n=1 Tax=Ilumatobacter sp. TaxID=1967498 RepID=UPI003299A021
MASLSDDRVREFLSTGTRTGKVAWVASNGAPHVAPIWFVLDGEDLVFNTGSSTGKGRSFAREGRASLVVDHEVPPYSFVKVDGTISLSDDLDEVRRFATLIGGRYMGADRAEEFGERNGVPGELLVRLHPTKVTAAFDLAD